MSIETCHRCRRDRDELSCYRCPRLNRRIWLESLEIGTAASIAGLLVLIVIFNGLGIS